MKQISLCRLLVVATFLAFLSGCSVPAVSSSSAGGGSAQKPGGGIAANGVPDFPREFRGAWSACVYNIDWPSSKGLSASAQKGQLISILNKMEAMNMNAIIFQVRPHADAAYKSNLEPWSHWLSGSMGRSPGYDPLQFCIEQAHARGIEVHAWFNPFRALSNASQATSSNHITRTKPHLIKRYANYKWMDISKSESSSIAINVIMDVVKRYDVDGVHLDDYFYPYPKSGYGSFPDGKTPAQRRGYVNSFVSNLYRNVKSTKPWVRVGISPFGIWRPGVPSTIEANVDAYEDLAADSRKWLKSGWVDYMMPQLYWRDYPAKQSYSTLLSWWRSQGSRPVWPGIATARINSSEDPGRPASEITKQVDLSRTIGRNWNGHAHWSVKSLMQNKGGVSSSLSRNAYGAPALVPPMPWVNGSRPAAPTGNRSGSSISWNASGASKVAIQILTSGQWRPYDILPAYKKGATNYSAVVFVCLKLRESRPYRLLGSVPWGGSRAYQWHCGVLSHRQLR